MDTIPPRHLVVGVTGGIAAFRSVELVRELQKRGYSVRVVMTANAHRFIGPLTFESLTGYPVTTSMFDAVCDHETIRHTALADWADGIVIAPATANILAKAAHGIADDFLSTLLLASDNPLLFAPAMNPRMMEHPATVENIRILKARGAEFVGPETGEVACGHVGPGKMSTPVRIADITGKILGADGDFRGIRAMVTAGPTREPIDPVRFLSNRSSGKMGCAIAAALVERGAAVTLVTGHVHEIPHAGVRVERVMTADEMHDAVIKSHADYDLIIMAAAVADWKPETVRTDKWKKSGDSASLDLVRTPDILMALSKQRKSSQIVIGFAAETGNVLENASAKCAGKKLDAIVANDISGTETGFASDRNTGTILSPSGDTLHIPPCDKRTMADTILDYVRDRLLKDPNRRR